MKILNYIFDIIIELEFCTIKKQKFSSVVIFSSMVYCSIVNFVFAYIKIIFKTNYDFINIINYKLNMICYCYIIFGILISIIIKIKNK